MPRPPSTHVIVRYLTTTNPATGQRQEIRVELYRSKLAGCLHRMVRYYWRKRASALGHLASPERYAIEEIRRPGVDVTPLGW